MKLHCLSRLIPMAVFAALLLGGCASFPDSEFPRVEKLPDRSTFKNKPSVYVDVKTFMDQTEDLSKTIENPAAVGHFKSSVEKVTKESGLFSKYTLDPFQGKEMDYVVKLEMINHVPNIGGAVVSGFITGFTLFVIPGAATDHYVLRAKVQDKGGSTIKSYEYRSSVTTWFGIWLLPFAGNSPQTVIPEHWEYMVKRAYEQIINDNLMRYSALPAEPAQVARLESGEWSLMP